MKLLENIDKNFIEISINCRLISISISTLVYLLIPFGRISWSKIAIACGMIAACFIGNYLYRKNISESFKIPFILTLFLEILAYGAFIILSGGLASPYFWYFISSLTILMVTERFRLITAISIFWCLICAFIGKLYRYPHESISSIDVNIGIGFLVVAMSFYTLFTYNQELNSNQKALQDLNTDLIKETDKSQQALNHLLDLYETINLFTINNQAEILRDLCEILKRTISHEGCMVLKFNLDQQIANYGSSGLPDADQEQIIIKVSNLTKAKSYDSMSEIITINDTDYSFQYIHKFSNLAGMLITPKQNQVEMESESQRQFYFNIIRIVFKEIDLQEMIEDYIVSEEQNRIASEIHDTVIQKLFAMACNLHLLKDRNSDIAEAELREHLSQIGKSIESTIGELRDTIYGLRWDSADKDIFISKLMLYMDELRQIRGTTIDMTIDEKTQFMNRNQKSIFYQVTCEAVNNAVRHGNASKVQVEIRLDDEFIQAEIKDNGMGFISNPLPKTGQGLKNMYRIVNLLKGQFYIDSAPGNGTTVIMSLPR